MLDDSARLPRIVTIAGAFSPAAVGGGGWTQIKNRKHPVTTCDRPIRRRNSMSVGDQVKDIIADKLDVARDKVKDEAGLQTDLGADSLDVVKFR